MGFTVYYRSTEPVSQSIRESIEDYLDNSCEERTWLSCEPILFFGNGGSVEHLMGGSKPNFDPHPDDIASAEKEGSPDGTLQDVVDILCQVSAQFKVDWDFSHDHDEGPVGSIINGQSDEELKNLVEGIMSMCDVFDEEFDNEVSDLENSDVDQDDDEGPQILKFPQT